MAYDRPVRGTIAILGAAAAAVVAVLLGLLYWVWSEPQAPAQNTAPVAEAPAPQQAAPPQNAPPQTAADNKAPQKPAAQAEAPAAPQEPPVVPSFDVVRVEPNGESVIAGRAAPGATIELLRGDQIHARAVADASGLFAIVPPPLPPGSHQVSLQAIAPHGARQRSVQSVTVVIGDGKTRPLVALTAPDKPTVLLSNPEPPEAKVAEGQKPQPEKPQPQVTESKPAEPPAQPIPQQEANAAPGPAPQTPAPQPAPAQPAPRPEIKIVAVEAEEGKLYVSGQSAPGATIRLYLNESLIAPGGAGSDGKVSFSIGSGVQPGDYRIRLDDVDPVSGQVKSRAQVNFNVPAQIAAASPQAPAAVAPSEPPPPQTPAPNVENQTTVASAGPSVDAQVAAAGTVVIPNINTAIVSKGDNLWRISQRIYGKGFRYTVIYGANQDQIRNPHLIYPGQVFVLPNDETPKSN